MLSSYKETKKCDYIIKQPLKSFNFFDGLEIAVWNHGAWDEGQFNEWAQRMECWDNVASCWDCQGLQKVKGDRKSSPDFDSRPCASIGVNSQPITMYSLCLHFLTTSPPPASKFCWALNPSPRTKISRVMTWFSCKEEANLAAGTRRPNNPQSSRQPLFPSFIKKN